MTKLATLTEMIERTVSEILKGVGTSIPGHVDSFDTTEQLAKVQIGVQFIDVQGQSFEIAPIVNVPVHFPGGDFSIEYQIDEGMEGLILISQRCIDAWKEEGGVATQPILRKLDMQDALFIPGFRSKPNKLADFQNNGIRMRNLDATQYFWLKNDGKIEGKCTDFNMISNTFKHNGVNIGELHAHSQANDSGGNTEQDTGVPS